METSIQSVAIAALLHDIGKIYIRGYGEQKKDQIINKNKELLQIYPEINKNKHTIYGYEMLQNIPFDDFVKSSILHHHTQNPTNPVIKIISIANKISSAEKVENIPTSPYQSYQLISVFSELGKQKGRILYKPLRSISETIYEKEYLSDKPISKDEAISKYQEISNKILKNLQLYHGDPEDIFFLYREYSSNIPSSYYYSKPTISLFAHSLSTAAIATSIFSQFLEHIINQNYDFINIIEQELYKNYSEQPIFGLIKGDISGIQNFIFNTSYHKALKQLKGKSFYLELLTELIARYIIYSEGLTITNILMIGGGHFYLLTPAKTIDNLQKYKKNIEKLIYKAHKNQISFIISGVKVSIPELIRFSKTLQKLNTIHEQNKFQKNKSVVFDPDNKFFEPKYYPKDSCPYCNRDIKGEECDFCESFADLATKLSKNKYLHISYSPQKNIEKIDSVYQVFESLGFSIHFSNEEKIPREKNNLISFKISRKYQLEEIFKKYLIIANYIPLNENKEIKSLDEISESSKGIKRWGILKGDVDNLGKIFQTISNEQEFSSLSKTITLSLELKTFFGIYVEKIVEENYKDCLVVYSGGDDFLIIGPYDRLYQLAQEIEKEFKKFTGENLTLSISFVIAVNLKHPVFRVASEADENLEKAKTESTDKNAINIFAKTIKWSDLQKFNNILNTITNIISKDGGSKAIINYLLDATKYKDYKLVPSWRLFYKLNNYKSRYRQTSENVDKLIDLIYKKEGNKIYENLYEATKLADYLTR